MFCLYSHVRGYALYSHVRGYAVHNDSGAMRFAAGEGESFATGAPGTPPKNAVVFADEPSARFVANLLEKVGVIAGLTSMEVTELEQAETSAPSPVEIHVGEDGAISYSVDGVTSQLVGASGAAVDDEHLIEAVFEHAARNRPDFDGSIGRTATVTRP